MVKLSIISRQVGISNRHAVVALRPNATHQRH
jgi:hypothetical protein